MTALCPGSGPSQPRSLTPGISILTNVALQAIAEEALGATNPWVTIIIAAATTSIDTSGFCTSDPPSWPSFTAAETAEVVLLGSAASAGTLAKVGQAVMNLVWPVLCECVTGTASGAPAPPTYPTGGAGTPQPGGGLIPSPTAGPCHVFSSTNNWDYTPSGAFLIQFDWDSDDVPSTAPSDHGATSCVWNATLQPISGPGVTVTFTFHCKDINSVTLNSPPGLTMNPGDTTAWTIPIVPNTNVVEIDYSIGAGSGTSELYDPATSATGYHVDFYCDGATPGGTNTPCCPPDPNLQATLTQIQQMVTAIYQSIPVPLTSYAEGAAATGLTGSGTLAISPSTIAIQVHVTTIPSHLGRDPSSPELYFDMGYIAFTTIEGTYTSSRLTFETQVFTVPPLGYTVSYTLLGGAIATITELTRGP